MPRFIHESVRANAPKILLEIEDLVHQGKDVRYQSCTHYRVDVIDWDGRCGGLIVKKVLANGKLSRSMGLYVGIGLMRGYVIRPRKLNEEDGVYLIAHPLQFEAWALNDAADALYRQLKEAQERAEANEAAVLQAVEVFVRGSLTKLSAAPLLEAQEDYAEAQEEFARLQREHAQAKALADAKWNEYHERDK